MTSNNISDPAVAAYVSRVFGPQASVERTLEGVSALVYRLDRLPGVAYLRLGEAPDEDLSTDAALLDHLRGLGVLVPEVIHVDPLDEALGRSVLVMSAIEGQHVGRCDDREAARRVAHAAGAQLALLHSVQVDGWGWVVRDGSWPLAGTWPEHGQFVWSELPNTWPGDLSSVLAPAELEALWTCFNEEPTSELAPCLAHGDFDVTPIFYRHDGRYSGLINFGEIRGTEPTFDLGHFLLHDMETAPWPLLEDVLDGYASMNPGPAEDRAAIRRSALQLGTRQLARWFKRFGPQRAPGLPLVQGRVQRLRELLSA